MECSDKYFDLKEKIESMEIDINDEGIISDVILKENSPEFTYYNTATHAQGNTLENVIRKGKHFIVLNPYSHSHEGFYVFESKEYGALICVITKLEDTYDEYKWKEKTRGFITKDGFWYMPTLASICRDAVDICGQYVSTGCDSAVDFCASGTNASCGSALAMWNWFGGYVLEKDNFTRTWDRFHMFQKAESIFYLFEYAKYDKGNELYPGGIECFDQKFKVKDKSDIPDPPKEAMEALKFCLKKVCLMPTAPWAITHFSHTPSLKEWKYPYIVQRVGNDLYQRYYCYMPVFDERGKLKELFIKEYKNVQIRSSHCDTPYVSQGVCIWCDDLDGTFLQYTGWLLKDWVKTYSQIAEQAALGAEFGQDDYFEKLNAAMISADNKYGRRASVNFTYLCTLFTDYPVLEKMAHLDTCGWFGKADFITMLCGHSESPKDIMLKHTGIDITAPSLGEALNMPIKAFFHILNKNSYKEKEGGFLSITEISCIRTMFDVSPEAKKYLRNMNTDDFFILSSRIEVINHLRLSSTKKILRYLAEFAGYKNWKTFTNILVKYQTGEVLCRYEKYLSMLSVFDVNVKQKKWRVEPEFLEEAIAGISDAYLMATEGEQYKKVQQDYDRNYSAWKKLEYKGSMYSVIAPRNPMELSREGFDLNHCAAKFINAVAAGTTNLLFIRKNEDIKKPFYTLEIKYNRIRQCHGKNNSNVSKDSDLDIFLQEYCKEKHLRYSRGEQQLAV